MINRKKSKLNESKLIIEYMKTTLNKYTFSNKRIRTWVEKNSNGYVLNLFAGETKLNLNEVRNDIHEDSNAEYHKDALCFVKEWDGEKFDTVILDPPYSIRKSMELYHGRKMSEFNAIKDELKRILKPQALVITFGYHSNSMGESRGFKQNKILLMSHGGAIHDTIAVIEILK